MSAELVAAPPRSDRVRRIRQCTRRGIRWCVRAFLVLILGYGLIILVGLIPRNNGFRPTPGGITIQMISNAVHSEFILPISDGDSDWRDEFEAFDFPADTSWATRVAVGWGDKGFFINTPTWSDLKLSTALHALFWPSDTCLHVSMISDTQVPLDARSICISPKQYHRLCEFIRTSLKVNDAGKPMPIAGAHYSSNDAFYEALGCYHCLNTCNSWVGRGLQAAGVRVPLLTPLPKTAFLYLPKN